jgi:hypothetical protein
VTRSGREEYGSRCRRSRSCSRDISARAAPIRSRCAPGNRPALISSRSRSPSSSYTAVIACRGIVASSRPSTVLNLVSSGAGFAVSCGATVSPSRVPD